MLWPNELRLGVVDLPHSVRGSQELQKGALMSKANREYL